MGKFCSSFYEARCPLFMKLSCSDVSRGGIQSYLKVASPLFRIYVCLAVKGFVYFCGSVCVSMKCVCVMLSTGTVSDYI